MIKDIQEIMMFVSDIGRAKVWYSEFLNIQPNIDDDNYCQFKLGRVELGLHPADEKMSSGRAGTVAYWQVDNMNLVIQKACDTGAQVYRGPRELADRKICQILDPFGNVLGLVEFIGD